MATSIPEYRGYGLSNGSPSEKGLYIDARAAVDYLYTRHDLDHSQIVLFGRSLGGGVVSIQSILGSKCQNRGEHWKIIENDDQLSLPMALTVSLSCFQVIDVAADPNYGSKIMCSIVENTFTSIPHMARTLISHVSLIPLICHKNRVSVKRSYASPATDGLFTFLQFNSIDKVQKISAPILFVSGLNDSLVPASMMTALHGRCKSSRKQLFQLSGGHMDTWNANG